MLRRVCGISFDVSIYFDVIYSMVFEWAKDSSLFLSFFLFSFGVKDGREGGRVSREEGRLIRSIYRIVVNFKATMKC